MKAEDQLIALHEWMGWTDITANPFAPNPPLCGFNESQGKTSSANAGSKWGMPPLTLDLMHEAEKRICEEATTGYTYDMALCDVVGVMEENHPNFMRLWHATKEQRLEALLKTICKWEPTHSPKIDAEGLR